MNDPIWKVIAGVAIAFAMVFMASVASAPVPKCDPGSISSTYDNGKLTCVYQAHPTGMATYKEQRK